MKSKAIKAGIVAFIVLIGAYWYWSPYLAVWQVRSAAQAQDADAFNQHVDYPKLRDSIKDQFSALFTDLPSESPSDGAPGKAGASFGKMLGLIVVNKLVDVVVRPELVMQAMRQGYLTPKPPGRTGDPAAQPNAPDAGKAPGSDQDKKKLVFQRQGANRMLIYSAEVAQVDSAAHGKLGLVFERSGFATWKLSEVMLPSLIN